MKSKTSHAVLDVESRKKKASTIIGILKNYKDIKRSRILDIGTGSGVTAHEIGKLSKKVFAVDVNDERVLKGNYAFRKIKNERLPFDDNDFDIVISNHVMAHVKNNDLHLSEINRVLKKDGIVYLSMLNRLWVLEPNFNLLFLSWLPKKLADSYVKLAGRGENYNVIPLTYFGFIKKIRKYFLCEDITIKVINENSKVPKSVYSSLKFLSPVWIFILRSKHYKC